MPELLMHALFGALAVTDPGMWAALAMALAALGLMGLAVCLVAEAAESRQDKRGEKR
jgi:hypothetical protein